MVEPEARRFVTPPDLRGCSVVVVGIGKSGVAASHLLHSVGAQVTIVDEKDESVLVNQIASLRQDAIRVLTGIALQDALHDVDLVVLSPGVPTDHPALTTVRDCGVRIIGEIELASWFFDVPLIAVTGTNGKSTTVRLIGAILEESGKKAFVGGNVGVPLCEAVLPPSASVWPQRLSTSSYEYVIAEVSSFQLETIEQFHPWISVLLNITPDHLDRHPSLSHYQASKQKVFQNQTVGDVAVLNVDDPIIAGMGEALSGTVIGFSLVRSLQQGVYLQGHEIKARLNDLETVVVTKDQIRLPGNHNVANVLAAVAIGMLCGCPLEAIRRAVSTFPGLEHAMEFVREVRGVKYFNDSKGTNVDATGKALESFEEPILLILGGKDKGGDFNSLRDLVRRKVKRVFVIGEATPRLVRVLNEVKPISLAGSLSEAITLADREADAGDVVLLSPACAIFDMFRNYDERGK
ncbi:MAG: UDP-N-acetylmuramoyl-L-alanine--D-glutamate ligase [Nitrospirota bacterium]|nr:MAG: UDP-N-acetylmuramoyl-L-alanine--D-glutamate ligase [Nitrospirota bacterium]